jgi:cell division protein FtsB
MLAVIGAVVAYYFVAGPDGFFVQWEVSKEIEELREQSSVIRAQNTELMDHIGRLNGDIAYIERIARERYGMALPNERVYRIIIPPAPKTGDGTAQ